MENQITKDSVIEAQAQDFQTALVSHPGESSNQRGLGLNTLKALTCNGRQGRYPCDTSLQVGEASVQDSRG